MTPPSSGTASPARDVPAPLGTTGNFSRFASFMIADTWFVLIGHTAASGLC